MAMPDLTSFDIACAFRGLISFQDGVACYMEAGFTSQSCATIWAYDAQNTNINCGCVCATHAASGNPNFGPPPTCTPADCLVCDEQQSGPKSKQFAVRTRRNSGLLSGQVRNCTEIAPIVQQDPCSVDLMTPSSAPVTASPACGGLFASRSYGADCCSGRCVFGECRTSSLSRGKTAEKLSRGYGGAAGGLKGVRGL